MLRSRGNRSQRPSEPTDERSGSAGYYAGYPSSHTSPMAVGLGGDSEGFHPGGQQQQQQQQHYYHGQSNTTNSFSYPQKSSPRMTQNPFKEKSKGSQICGGVAWYCFVLVLLLGLSVDNLRRFKSYRHTAKHLAELRERAEDFIPVGRTNTDDDPPSEAETQQELKLIQRTLHAVSETQSQLNEALMHYNSRQIPNLKSELRALDHQIEATTKENESHTAQLEALRQLKLERREEIKRLQNHFTNLHKSPSGNLLLPQAGSGARVEVGEEHGIESVEDLKRYVEEREDVLWDKIDGLMERLKGQSRVEVVEWFGPGPHKVELEIEYPRFDGDLPPEEWPRVRGVLLVELAPLDLMPVTINLFLQQVHHKLWDGCAFVINAMHILQAGPHKFNGERFLANDQELIKGFTQNKLDKMPFQEYHEDYPHEQWTLGYAGRPAGPDFYINKINNTRNHGPGGQMIHDLHEEADPCFGKIVSGTEHLADINKIPIGYGEGFVLKHHVQIVQARVVTEERNPLEEHDHTEDNPDNSSHEEHGEETQAGVSVHEENYIVRAGPGPSPI